MELNAGTSMLVIWKSAASACQVDFWEKAPLCGADGRSLDLKGCLGTCETVSHSRQLCHMC